MKSTQVKDAIRTIKRYVVSYISIITIAMLAVTAYLGIKFTSVGVANNATEFFDSTNFRDVEIMSTLLITPEDIDLLRSYDGVTDVEGAYRTDGKLFSGNTSTDVVVVSLTERINTCQIVEGRLPQAENECVIEVPISEDMGYKIGDTIEVLNAKRGTPDYLLRTEYVITGLVFHPDHSCWPLMTPGPRYIVVLPEVFDQESLDGCFMSAELTLDGVDGLGRYDESYLEITRDMVDRLNEIAPEREARRYDDIYNRYQEQIDAAQAQLDEAYSELTAARAELDANWAEYNDGLAQYEDGQEQLAQAEQDLANAALTLQNGRTRLDEASAQLADAQAQLEAGWATLAPIRAQLDAAAAELAEGNERLEAAAAQLAAGQAELTAAEIRISAGAAQLQAAQTQLTTARSQLESGYTQLEDAKANVRSQMYTAVAGLLGTDFADSIPWASSDYDVNVDDPSVSAGSMGIIDGVSINISVSAEDYIARALAAAGTEDDLADLYEAVTGTELHPSSGETVYDALADLIITEFPDVTSKYDEFSTSANTWDSGHTEYIDGVSQYNASLVDYNNGVAEYNAGRAAYEAGLAEYNAGLEEYNKRYAEYQDGEAQYAVGYRQYQAGLAEYEANRAEYEAGEEEYQNGLNAYNAGLAEYQEKSEELAEARTQLDEAYEQLTAGEAEYEDGLARYNDGLEELNSAIQRQRRINDCHWIVINVEGSAGYMYINSAVSNNRSLGGTFAFVFVIVAALVIYATVGKIIEDHRTIVGTTKALGLTNGEVLIKYTIFGLSATIIGVFLGVAAGYFGIESMILYITGRYYVFGAGHRSLDVTLTLIVFAGAVILAWLAVWLACGHLLKSTALALISENVPGFNPELRRKRKAKRGVKDGALYPRLILFNMLTDWKRVIVTIASIAGCCTLLVAGLSMNFAVNKSINNEFDNIEIFDEKIQYDPDVSETAGEDIESILAEAGVSYIPITDVNQMYKVGGKLNTTELFCCDVNALNDYFITLDPDTYQRFDPSGDGMYIYYKMMERNNVTVGQEITLFDNGMNPYPVTVAGVHEVHIGYYSVMSEEVYLQTFGSNPVHNAFLVNFNGADAAALNERLSDVNGLTNIYMSSDRYNEVKGLAAVLVYVSIILIFIAALMALFIILNLVNIFIMQKNKELTLMRINGFSLGQTKRYVLTDIVVCTVVGVIVGVVLGLILAYRVIVLTEGAGLHFVKDVQPGALVLSIGLTLLYVFLVTFWAMRRIKDLKLSDLLQT